jgi:hypothetical protein
LILAFVPTPGGGRIDLLHLDVPEVDYRGVTQGWDKFYWIPWKQYLKKNGKSAEVAAETKQSTNGTKRRKR